MPDALPELMLPAVLPCWLAAGHDMQTDPVYANVPMRTGHSLKRRVYRSAPRVVTVGLALSEFQMRAFFGWFENTLRAGAEAFAAHLPNQGPGLLWWHARFVEPPTYETLKKGLRDGAYGQRYRVRAKLLLSGSGSATAPAQSSLAATATVALHGSAVLTVGKPLAATATIALLPAVRMAATATVALLPAAPTTPGPIGGVAAVTLGGATLAGSGNVRITASVAATLAGATLSASIVGSAVYSLDPYTANLWGAWSLRRLLTSYAGPLIRARRASDNAEQDIGYITNGELDVTALVAFAGAGSAFVAKMYGQNAGPDLVQATAGKQPKIVDAGSYLGFATFDGADDCMTSSAASGTPSALSLFMTAFIRSLTGTRVLAEHGPAFPTAAKNQFLYYNTGSATTRTGVDISAGASDYFENFFNEVLDPYTVHAAIGDRSQGTQLAQAKLYTGSAGTAATRNGSATAGSLPTGNFTAETWNIGARDNGASLAASLDLSTLVIYESAKTADVAGICAAVA